ncbi:YihY/virulence factor BrkB family protein [Halorubellus sp. PRR65]|uniref:YihY/virulence factor BrkB family protein n=1 Tax=Halorubellus sp. PRR65 TaxID=3098148 RepID=UPI002B262B49|nr:YihY/virulence factor BrkB family protein [Halorubellus sp. PRR65]
MDLELVVSRAKSTWTVFGERNVTFLAGSIAYSAFVSLVPLLLFFFLVVSVLGAPELQGRIVDVTTESVSPAVGGVIEVMIASQADASTGSTVGASVIGALTLAWGAIKVFRGLDTAFSTIYGTTAAGSFVGQLEKILLVLATLTAGIVAMVGATSIVAFVSTVPLLGVLVPLVLVGALVVAFLPMYYLFPDVDHEPRDVLPGAIIAAVGWTVLQVLFQVYASLGGEESNLIASILLFVTWLYFTGVVLLFGATYNAVLLAQSDATAAAGGEAIDRTENA